MRLLVVCFVKYSKDLKKGIDEMTTRRVLPPEARPQKTETVSLKQELPIDSRVQIYPRVSSTEQKKNVSAEMQQDKGFALLCGWKDELIIMDTDDLGLSGQLRMEDRPAFVKMLRNMVAYPLLRVEKRV